MNQKLILVAGVVILLLVGGYFLSKSMSPSVQNSVPAPVENNTTPTTAPQTDQNSTAPSTGTQSASQNNIEIKNFAYSPKTLTVKIGDTVTWTNQDSAPHSATADDKSFDTGLLSKGQSGSVTFKKAGTFTYFCSAHPNMKATITVQ
jgi:plastocyanin